MCRGKSYVAAKRRTRRLRLKKEGLAGREPTTYGFGRQRLTTTPLRPVEFRLLSAIIWFIIWTPTSEKEKGLAGPVGLNASALPVHHPDLLYFPPLCDNMIDELKRVAYVYVWKRESAGEARTHDLLFWMPAPNPYPTPTCSFLSPLCDIWFINWNASPTSTCEKDKALAGGKPPIYDWEIETRRLRLRLKKRKRWRGANPRPIVLNASA